MTTAHRSASILVASVLALGIIAGFAFAHDMGGMDMGGSSSQDDSPNQMGRHMAMGPHMKMTDLRPATPEDTKRAEEILTTLRQSLEKYQDYKVATQDGYQPFLPTIPQEVYHFTNYSDVALEYQHRFDITKPGSLLYTRKGMGGNYKLVGVMYSAPKSMTPSELDEIVPLGIGRWHQHVNICLPQGVTLSDMIDGNVGMQNPHVAAMFRDGSGAQVPRWAVQRYGFMADPRFGFTGSIADQPSCEAAKGDFYPVAFGWMIHVYPFAGDDLKVAFGTDVP